MLYLLSTSCVHTLAYSTLFPLGDTLLLLSSCRREGVHPELPGVRGLLGVRLPVDIPVAPCFQEFLVYVLRFRILCIRHFVINVINNIRIYFMISLYVICSVIYCSFYCIYMWLDPGMYMIARFMSFYKPGVTIHKEVRGGINRAHTIKEVTAVQILSILTNIPWEILSMAKQRSMSPFRRSWPLQTNLWRLSMPRWTDSPLPSRTSRVSTRCLKLNWLN